MLDGEGRLLGTGRRPLQPSFGPAHAEGDASAWLAAALEAGNEAARGHEIEAIGVCALGPAPVLVDGALEPVAPALLFSLDRRASPSTLGVSHDHPLPKLHWWRDTRPEVWARASLALDATGFLVGRLTGTPVLDTITADAWSHPSEPPPIAIPATADPLAVAGGLLDEHARALGVRAGTPVTVGTYDTYADVLAAGVCSPGDACILLGSTLVLGAAVAQGVSAEGLEATGYLGDGAFLGGWTAAAGTTLDWCAALLGERIDVAALAPGAGGLLALPFLAGERTPVWDPDARGVVAGLSLSTGRKELYRAFVDAVALSAHDHVQRLRDAGITPPVWRTRGGGTADAAWLQAACNAVAAPLELVAHAGDAVGPAVLAHRATGTEVTLPVVRQLEPDPAHASRYGELYPRYRELYASTATLVHALAGGNA